jgi:hypothetical protein
LTTGRAFYRSDNSLNWASSGWSGPGEWEITRSQQRRARALAFAAPTRAPAIRRPRRRHGRIKRRCAAPTSSVNQTLRARWGTGDATVMRRRGTLGLRLIIDANPFLEQTPATPHPGTSLQTPRDMGPDLFGDLFSRDKDFISRREFQFSPFSASASLSASFVSIFSQSLLPIVPQTRQLTLPGKDCEKVLCLLFINFWIRR